MLNEKIFRLLVRDRSRQPLSEEFTGSDALPVRVESTGKQTKPPFRMFDCELTFEGCVDAPTGDKNVGGLNLG